MNLDGKAFLPDGKPAATMIPPAFGMAGAVDMITAKLGALHFYQLALPVPQPPEGSFERAQAARGAAIFAGKAQCATCHVPPLFTEPGWNTHPASDIGIDDFRANRSPERTARGRRSLRHVQDARIDR